ncbi:MAG: Maf family protein [Anaerolineae bacterium]
MEPPLILASSSPRRRRLLSRLASEFSVVAAAVDESRLPGERPAAYARRLAMEKAAWVAATVGDATVLGADTAVADGRDTLGKPTDAAAAGRMLQRLAGRWHLVITAVARVDSVTGTTVVDHTTTAVLLKALSRAEIHAYVASGRPMDKAGSYAIQDTNPSPVAAIVGSETNVVGLPLLLTRCLLGRAPRPGS